MSKDSIDRAIKKAIGGESENYDEIRYEGYGPGGVAIVVEHHHARLGELARLLDVGADGDGQGRVPEHEPGAPEHHGHLVVDFMRHAAGQTETTMTRRRAKYWPYELSSRIPVTICRSKMTNAALPKTWGSLKASYR